MHTRLDAEFAANLVEAVEADNSSQIRELIQLYHDLQRGWRDCGSHAEIPLTQGYWSKIDKSDLTKLTPYSWFAVGEGTLSSPIVARAKIGGRAFPLPRFLLDLEPGSALKVDHINYDNLDNRRDNLRIVTATESAQHRRAWVQTQEGSRFKGVYRRTDKNYRKPWRAVIKHNGSPVNLGYFVTEEAAARAYDAAVEQYHGEFGEKNFG